MTAFKLCKLRCFNCCCCSCCQLNACGLDTVVGAGVSEVGTLVDVAAMVAGRPGDR